MARGGAGVGMTICVAWRLVSCRGLVLISLVAMVSARRCTAPRLYIMSQSFFMRIWST